MFHYHVCWPQVGFCRRGRLEEPGASWNNLELLGLYAG